MLVTVLIISGCLHGNPNECREFKTRLSEEVTATQCLMTSPVAVSQWMQEHINWDFKRVTCTQAPLTPNGTFLTNQDI